MTETELKNLQPYLEGLAPRLFESFDADQVVLGSCDGLRIEINRPGIDSLLRPHCARCPADSVEARLFKDGPLVLADAHSATAEFCVAGRCPIHSLIFDLIVEEGVVQGRFGLAYLRAPHAFTAQEVASFQQIVREVKAEWAKGKAGA